ncbi:MAG: hypothetical protein VX622_10825, partial [Pseudomonadota bacterium]|nr:hypothetical protein [Pseudomonadota bacterium]
IPGFGVEVFAEDDRWNFERIGLLPRDAVLSGLGIRNGITENYNNHLNQVPAYGLTIQPNGHVEADEDWVGYDGRVLGTENECFLGCGLQNAVAEGSERHRHEVMMANFKALQMRMNWIYASAGSNLAGFGEHWHWVRQSLGRQRGDAFDAWAVLRESRDAFFAGSSDDARIRADVVGNWTRRPWVRNMERWLVQRDVCGDGVAQAGAERIGDLVDPKAVSFEGLRTDLARGQRRLYFDADHGLFHGDHQNIDIHVTYAHDADVAWSVEFQQGDCKRETATVQAAGDGSNGLKTATFSVPSITFANGFAGQTDFAIHNQADADLTVYFVRIVRTQAPTCGDGQV